MKISVTQEDIDNGVRGKCCECPIALAIKRATGCEELFVHRVGFHSDFGGVYRYRLLPGPAVDFIEAFDANSLVSPFEFELDMDRLSL